MIFTNKTAENDDKDFYEDQRKSKVYKTALI